MSQRERARFGSFVAHRYERAGITVFVVAIPIRAVSTLLPIPNPAEPFHGNRRVDAAHAEGFARYWQKNRRWAAPPLLLDTMYPLSGDFDERLRTEGAASGVLSLPDNAREVLEILDGQHRILGWHLAAEEVDAGLASSRRAIGTAHVLGDAGASRSGREALARFEALERRLDTEYVTLEIFEGIGLEEHRQFFSDIATNAKGINKSVMTAFDQRGMVNRVAAQIAASHPLVLGLVDFEKDRTAGSSENFLSAKNVGDIIRATAIGFESRAAQKREALLEEANVRAVTLHFLDVLTDEVSDLAAIPLRSRTVADVRARSLVASATVVRCLAGAFRLVAVDGIEECRPVVNADGEELFRRLLRRLDAMWGFPLDPRWLDTGYFPHAGSKAPSSRSQDLKGLTLALGEWASHGCPARAR